jgi:hypothetical protein
MQIITIASESSKESNVPLSFELLIHGEKRVARCLLVDATHVERYNACYAGHSLNPLIGVHSGKFDTTRTMV